MRTSLMTLCTVLSLSMIGCAYEMPSNGEISDAADASTPPPSESDDVGSSVEALSPGDQNQCGGFVYYEREFRESCGFGGWTREVRQECQALKRAVVIRPGVIRCVIDYSTQVCETMYRGPCEPPIDQTPG